MYYDLVDGHVPEYRLDAPTVMSAVLDKTSSNSKLDDGMEFQTSTAVEAIARISTGFDRHEIDRAETRISHIVVVPGSRAHTVTRMCGAGDGQTGCRHSQNQQFLLRIQNHCLICALHHNKKIFNLD